VAISGSTVAIIGTGNIGARLAANFAVGGQDFLLAGRDSDAVRGNSHPTSTATPRP
jgi:predicted dinucleotide-binding enzyme